MASSYAGVTFVFISDDDYHAQWSREVRVVRHRPVNGSFDVKVATGSGDWQIAVLAGSLTGADVATLLAAANGVTPRTLVLDDVTFANCYLEAGPPRKLRANDYYEVELTFSRES